MRERRHKDEGVVLEKIGSRAIHYHKKYHQDHVDGSFHFKYMGRGYSTLTVALDYSSYIRNRTRIFFCVKDNNKLAIS